MNNFLLHAFSFSKEKIDEIDLQNIDTFDHKDTAWFHLDGNDSDTADWLRERVHTIPDYVIDELLATEIRPRVKQFNNGMLLILRGINSDKNADPEDMVSIRLWVEENGIYSVGRRKLTAIADIAVELQLKNGPAGVAEFICSLVSKLLFGVELAISALDDKTDEIEESITDESTADLRQTLVQIRKRAIMFKRYMSPQRDAIVQLINSNTSWLELHAKLQLQENLNKVTRFIEDLEAIRERAQIVKDELSHQIADRMNQNTYVLSVIAALFLPLGFLTGLLGINLAGIPGAENSNAFFMFCGILATVIIVQVALFKKKKWF